MNESKNNGDKVNLSDGGYIIFDKDCIKNNAYCGDKAHEILSELNKRCKKLEHTQQVRNEKLLEILYELGLVN